MIRWEDDVFAIAAAIRAVTPMPGARASLSGKDIVVHRARPLDLMDQAAPGEVVDVTQEEGIVVSTGRGRLAILELQAAGRRVLSGVEYARGARLRPGDRFASSVFPERGPVHAEASDEGGLG